MEDAKLPELDFSAGAPLYQQVKAWLLNGIEQGWWPVTAAIPSERVLSEQLHISRATLRQAVDELENEGWLVRRQGRGTFVGQPKLEQPLDQLRGFTENMLSLGVQPSTLVLDARLEPAEPEVARALGLQQGEAVAAIRRSRLVDGVPLMVEDCYLNYARTLGVLDRQLSGSLYSILEQDYGIRLVLSWETLEVSRAEAWAARALDLPVRSDALYTERLAADTQGTQIEFTRRYARADRCRFRIGGGTGGDVTLRERSATDPAD